MELSSFYIPFISGLAGFLGGVVATYIKWDVEKRKIKAENRKERINAWKTEVGKAEEFDDLWGTAILSDLKQHFTEKELETLHANIANIGSGGTGDDIKKDMLYSVISRVEKAWGLI